MVQLNDQTAECQRLKTQLQSQKLEANSRRDNNRVTQDFVVKLAEKDDEIEERNRKVSCFRFET